MHGEVPFALQRYCQKDDANATDFFRLNDLFTENLRTKRLNNYLFKHANRMSYRHLAENLSEVARLSTTAASLERTVVREGRAISAQNAAAIAITNAQPALNIASACDIDIYTPAETSKNTEINVFYDGICVKRQCPFRNDNPQYEQLLKTKDQLLKRVNTNVAVLQLPDNQFIKLTEGLSSKGFSAYSTIDLVEHTLKVHYGKLTTPLQLVAITDGASSIRTDFSTKLSPDICIILDWYHLKKKVRELMSMIAVNKTEKTVHIKLINKQLWNGKTDDVLAYLQSINVKNKDVLDQLITYFTKHKVEIIDYERRKKAGKTIGSGRGEKANDQLIARRQKKKGLSWSNDGSKALAIIATKYG